MGEIRFGDCRILDVITETHAQDGSAFVPRECMRIHGRLTTSLFSLNTSNQGSAAFVGAWHRLTDSNGTTVAMSELEGGQIISKYATIVTGLPSVLLSTCTDEIGRMKKIKISVS